MSILKLNAIVMGDGPPLLIIHGLFGSARNWNSIARALSDQFQVHCLDLRNHGQSPWSDEMRYETMAEDVAAYILDHGLAPCDIVGHSMGGKTAMWLAMSLPDLVQRLVVVDIAPVPYIRESFSEYVAAMQALDLKRHTRRPEIDTLLAPAIPDPSLRAFLMQNLVSEHGQFQWRINLKAIGANLPAIVGYPDTQHMGFSGMTTFLAGERSDYIRPRDETTMRRLFPHHHLKEIAQAGHWPHAEQPEKFLALVRAALPVSGV